MAISTQCLEKFTLSIGRVYSAETRHTLASFSHFNSRNGSCIALSNGPSVHRNRRYGSAKVNFPNSPTLETANFTFSRVGQK